MLWLLWYVSIMWAQPGGPILKCYIMVWVGIKHLYSQNTKVCNYRLRFCSFYYSLSYRGDPILESTGGKLLIQSTVFPLLKHSCEAFSNIPPKIYSVLYQILTSCLLKKGLFTVGSFLIHRQQRQRLAWIGSVWSGLCCRSVKRSSYGGFGIFSLF